jgi:hypothetical protein
VLTAECWLATAESCFKLTSQGYGVGRAEIRTRSVVARRSVAGHRVERSHGSNLGC